MIPLLQFDCQDGAPIVENEKFETIKCWYVSCLQLNDDDDNLESTLFNNHTMSQLVYLSSNQTSSESVNEQQAHYHRIGDENEEFINR